MPIMLRRRPCNYFLCIYNIFSSSGLLARLVYCISLIYTAITRESDWIDRRKPLRTPPYTQYILLYIILQTHNIDDKFNRVCGDLFFFDLLHIYNYRGVPRITFCFQRHRVHVFIIRRYNRTRLSQQEKFI